MLNMKFLALWFCYCGGIILGLIIESIYYLDLI